MAGLYKLTLTIHLMPVILQAKLSLYKHPVDWWTAKQTCLNNGGSLYGQGTVPNDIENGYLPLWLDAIVMWSPWIANAGCYRYRGEEDVDITDTYLLYENSAMSCLQKCSNTLPVGLFNNTCYCIRHFSDMDKVSGKFCNIVCSGEEDDLCGGTGALNVHTYFTIYNDMEASKIENDTMKECVKVKIEDRKYIFKDEDCSKVLPFLCQDSKRHIVERTEDKSWQDARHECVSFNLELANVKSILLTSSFMENTEYWTGHHRIMETIWHLKFRSCTFPPNVRAVSVFTPYIARFYQLEGVELAKPNACYLVGRAGYKMANCTTKNSFVCVFEDETSSTYPTVVYTLLPNQGITQKQKDAVNLSVITGVSVGVVAVFILIGSIVLIVCLRKRKLKRNAKSSKTSNGPEMKDSNEENEQFGSLFPSEPVYSKPDKQEQPSEYYSDNKTNQMALEPDEKEIETETYDHLRLDGPRVSFLKESENTYDISGVDSYGISHTDRATKLQPIRTDDTYDHAT